MPRKNELSTREGNCASPASHRNEFPAEYSLTGCSPAEPASASPAELILQPQHLFCQYNTANGILHNPSVSHKMAHSTGSLPKSCTILHIPAQCNPSAALPNPASLDLAPENPARNINVAV